VRSPSSSCARASLQDELDVLAGVVAQRVVGRQLQVQDRDVGRRLLDRITRHGILRIANSPAPGTVRTSSTTSVCGAAWQVSTRPASSSTGLRALV
jgi:hypothetical protein